MGISLQLPSRPKVELPFTFSPVDFFSPLRLLLLTHHVVQKTQNEYEEKVSLWSETCDLKFYKLRFALGLAKPTAGNIHQFRIVPQNGKANLLQVSSIEEMTSMVRLW